VEEKNYSIDGSIPSRENSNSWLAVSIAPLIKIPQSVHTSEFNRSFCQEELKTMKKLTGLAMLCLSLVCVPKSRADRLGVANGAEIQCPSGVVGGVCYQVNLACPGVTNFNGYLKVTTPQNPAGTVILTTGGGGTNLYEHSYKYGNVTVANLVKAGFTTVQVSWNEPFTETQPDGWQSGPGGIRALACRYATLAQWIHDNIHQGGSGAPMCATGNSAGGEQIGLSLAHYGLGSIFAMVEPTSGPPFARQDYSCLCNQPTLPDPCGRNNLTQCVGLKNAVLYVDPAYPGHYCSEAVIHHQSKHASEFLHDSILSPDADLSYPGTYVHFLWGAQDFTSAPVMGQLYEKSITTQRSSACVQDAGHNIANVLDGAQRIAQDLVTYCKLPQTQ